MAPSKKRKLRREEQNAETVELLHLPKPDEEEDGQGDYETTEDIRQNQVQQHQSEIQHHHQQPESQEADEYDDPLEDPEPENGGENSSDDDEDGDGSNGGRGDGEGDEDEGEEGEDGDIEKLLEPLPKERLVSLLRVAAALDPRFRAEIRRTVDQDPVLRRIFVHGINYSTSADTLRSFFEQYGKIDECRIVTDRLTGKSKGYGFIVYQHGRDARRALREPQKFIDGRMTACQIATAGLPAGGLQPPPAAPSSYPPTAPYHTPHDVLPRKIFVGNVHPDVNKDHLFQFFSQFGEIEEGPIGFDRQTGKAKGYALFIYKTVDAARRALQEPNKNFDGRLLYCQKATDSQRAKAAAAAAAAGPSAASGPVASDVQGNMGYNVPPGGGMTFAGPMDLGFAQGFLGAALPYAQGMQANPAALAMLAAAGANPAAFGVPPAMIASLNPALAAAMNQSGAQVASPVPVPQVQGYSMGPGAGYQNVGYQGALPQQNGSSYQAPQMTPAIRPAAGQMGGYGPH